MSGRSRLVTYNMIKAIDAWYSQQGYRKDPPFWKMAMILGISSRTLQNIALRRHTYAKVPRFEVPKAAVEPCRQATRRGMMSVYRGDRACLQLRK